MKLSFGSLAPNAPGEVDRHCQWYCRLLWDSLLDDMDPRIVRDTLACPSLLQVIGSHSPGLTTFNAAAWQNSLQAKTQLPSSRPQLNVMLYTNVLITL